MNFGEALEALKQGLQVQRGGWNGREMYVRLVSGTPELNRHLELFNVQGTFDTWVPSVSDLLATDWSIVNE